MLNPTYIWYSSIASTNCPHESKSVPFLKLACHFWIVLLTSDIVAGRVLVALSGQHSREGESWTGLPAAAAAASNRLSTVHRRTDGDRWHPDQAFSVSDIASAGDRKSRLVLGVRTFWDTGWPEWTATGCLQYYKCLGGCETILQDQSGI